MDYQTLILSLENHVAQVSINRPEKANALNNQSWEELNRVFEELDRNPEARVVILKGEGKHFCSGIDVSLLMELNRGNQADCEGRKREYLRQIILDLQAPIKAIEDCRKPVIAAIHNGCIGAAVDIISACDMRYATHDAFITAKEIDMGMVADLGTLQRLPKIIPDGIAREMVYTGRKVSGEEAKTFGLVNDCFEQRGQMLDEVMEIARQIAGKSPLSIRGTKEMLNYTRDHRVEDGLKYIATWNAAMLLSDDLMKAIQAQMTKSKPEFDN